MSKPQAKTWFSSDILERLSQTITRTAPVMEGEIVPLRASRDSHRAQDQRMAELMRQIANIQNAIVEKQAERSEIEREGQRALQAVHEQIARVQAENTEEESALVERLRDLQSILADIVRPSGLRVEVPR